MLSDDEFQVGAKGAPSFIGMRPLKLHFYKFRYSKSTEEWEEVYHDCFRYSKTIQSQQDPQIFQEGMGK
jgi:hypothetical protein